MTALDPHTGQVSAQPVLDVIVGHGGKHLIGTITSRAPPTGGETDEADGAGSWTATAERPVWVESTGLGPRQGDRGR